MFKKNIIPKIKRPFKPKYILHPSRPLEGGKVIGAERLAELHGVNFKDCIIYHKLYNRERDLSGMRHLYVKEGWTA